MGKLLILRKKKKIHGKAVKASHAYAITGILAKSDDQRDSNVRQIQIRIRNPWGINEWKKKKNNKGEFLFYESKITYKCIETSENDKDETYTKDELQQLGIIELSEGECKFVADLRLCFFFNLFFFFMQNQLDFSFNGLQLFCGRIFSLLQTEYMLFRTG